MVHEALTHLQKQLEERVVSLSVGSVPTLIVIGVTKQKIAFFVIDRLEQETLLQMQKALILQADEFGSAQTRRTRWG